MSRGGIGKTQRAILDALAKLDLEDQQQRGSRWFKTRDIAAAVYQVPQYAVTKRQMTLTQRPLFKLAIMGLVYSRSYRGGYPSAPAQWSVSPDSNCALPTAEFVEWHTADWRHGAGRMARSALKVSPPSI